MSTIATPRDGSVPRRINTNQTHTQTLPQIQTPTSSSRPSLEINTRSNDASPSRSGTQPARRNRAALQKYYNLKTQSTQSAQDAADTRSETSSIHDFGPTSPQSIMDQEGFDAEKYVKRVLEEESLSGLLRVYAGVLQEIRALDAERKALVYDNYSKLISATEMIGRMTGGIGGDEVGRTVGPAVGDIYEKVEAMRREMKDKLPAWQKEEQELSQEERIEKREKEVERKKARSVAQRVLGTPDKVRVLVENGDMEEARRMWEPTRALLERWQERGVGGSDVGECIEDGEAALRGEKREVDSKS